MPEQPALEVYHSGGRYDVVPPSAQAIFGEYFEAGQNHGRRVYKRRPKEDQTHLPQVVLFYWDSRNGKELAGWWFGDQIGGGQVWARNQAADALPPKAGWRCPVDGPPQPKVICMVRGRPAQGAALKQLQEALLLDEDAKEDEPEGSGSAKKRRASNGRQPPAKRRPEPQAFVLSSRLGESAPPKTKALLGEFTQQGLNHGRRTYFKPDGIGPVWLYYWDDRDGKSNSGWWLGEKVGGEDVYGVSQQHSRTPPSGGWRIPHDEALQRDVLLLPKGREEEAEMPSDERLDRVRDTVSELESACIRSLDAAQAVLCSDDGMLEEAIRAATEQLQARAEGLEEALESIGRHIEASADQGDTPDVESELGSQRERLQGLLDRIRPDLEKSQAKLRETEQQAAEERDGESIAEALPAAMELVSNAEMAAEAAASDEGAAKARANIQKANARVGEVLAMAAGFAPQARVVALREFEVLRKRCRAAEERMGLWEGSGEASRSAATKSKEPHAGGDAATGDGDLEAAAEGVETDAGQALETVRAVLQGQADTEAIQLCMSLLQEHATAVATMQKRLSRAIDLAGDAATESLAALGPRLKAAHAQLEKELGGVRGRASAERHVAPEQPAEPPQSVGPSMAQAQAATTFAEEAVEALSLEAGTAEWRKNQVEAAAQSGEFGIEIKAAVEAVQARAAEAQAAIAAARGGIDEQIKVARALPEERQKAVLLEIASMRKRVIEAQRRLNPFKRARAEYDQGVKARADLEALRSRAADVEAEADGIAAMLASPLAFEDEAAAVEASVQPAEAKVAKLLQLVERRARVDEVAAVREGLATLKRRAVAVQTRLGELRADAREQRQRAAGALLVQRAEAEARKAESWLEKIAEAEKPWADGREVVPEEEATPSLDACAALARQAEPATMAAKTAALEALVEARLLSEGSARQRIVAELQRIQARSDAAALKVTQLKIDTFARGVRLQMSDVIECVLRAEKEVVSMVTASQALGRDNLETATPEELRAAGAASLSMEAPAAAACAAARGALEKRQQDPKMRESPSFQTQLGKLRARLEKAEEELKGLGTAAREAEVNQRRLMEHQASLDTLESLVAQAELSVLPLGDEPEAEIGQGEESRATVVLDAQRQLVSWCAVCDKLLTSPHGALRLAASRLRKRGDQAQAKLDGAKELVREEVERAQRRMLSEDGEAKVQAAEEALVSAEDAEGPFLIGLELEKKQAIDTIEACEFAATIARKTIGEANSFLAAKRKEVAGFARQDGVAEDLDALVSRCKAAEERVAQFEKDTTVRKRTISGRLGI